NRVPDLSPGPEAVVDAPRPHPEKPAANRAYEVRPSTLPGLSLLEPESDARHQALREWPVDAHPGKPPVPLAALMETLHAALLATGKFVDPGDTCPPDRRGAWVAGSCANWRLNPKWKAQKPHDKAQKPHDIDPVLFVQPAPGVPREVWEKALREVIARELPGAPKGVLAIGEGADPRMSVFVPSTQGAPVDLRIIRSDTQNAYFDFPCNAFMVSLRRTAGGDWKHNEYSYLPGADPKQAMHDMRHRVYRRVVRLDRDSIKRAWKMQTQAFVPAGDYATELLQTLHALIDAEHDGLLSGGCRHLVDQIIDPVRDQGNALSPSSLAVLANAIAQVSTADAARLKQGVRRLASVTHAIDRALQRAQVKLPKEPTARAALESELAALRARLGDQTHATFSEDPTALAAIKQSVVQLLERLGEDPGGGLREPIVVTNVKQELLEVLQEKLGSSASTFPAAPAARALLALLRTEPGPSHLRLLALLQAERQG
ncbi:MAG TPA: hypothetical protein VFH51_09675, partial [Myxococcota bacterium]|nr:hypothetical protein [Myxococcota bacterium]